MREHTLFQANSFFVNALIPVQKKKVQKIKPLRKNKHKIKLRNNESWYVKAFVESFYDLSF